MQSQKFLFTGKTLFFLFIEMHSGYYTNGHPQWINLFLLDDHAIFSFFPLFYIPIGKMHKWGTSCTNTILSWQTKRNISQICNQVWDVQLLKAKMASFLSLTIVLNNSIFYHLSKHICIILLLTIHTDMNQSKAVIWEDTIPNLGWRWCFTPWRTCIGYVKSGSWEQGLPLHVSKAHLV